VKVHTFRIEVPPTVVLQFKGIDDIELEAPSSNPSRSVNIPVRTFQEGSVVLQKSTFCLDDRTRVVDLEQYAELRGKCGLYDVFNRGAMKKLPTLTSLEILFEFCAVFKGRQINCRTNQRTKMALHRGTTHQFLLVSQVKHRTLSVCA
jgi:hypothetical protein